MGPNFTSVAKWALTLSILTIATVSRADRLILIPLGKKVPFKAVKLSYEFDGAQSDRSWTTLTLGVGMSFEIELGYDKRLPGRTDETIDVSYNLNDPVIGYAPGITIGIQDVFDKSVDGRYAYLAATFQAGMSGELNMEMATEGTFGVRVGEDRFHVFAGASIPWSTQFLFLIETQTPNYFAGGLEYRPTPGAKLRWIHRRERSSWQLSYLMRF